MPRNAPGWKKTIALLFSLDDASFFFLLPVFLDTKKKRVSGWLACLLRLGLGFGLGVGNRGLVELGVGIPVRNVCLINRLLRVSASDFDLDST